jgi:hypothetical protein
MGACAVFFLSAHAQAGPPAPVHGAIQFRGELVVGQCVPAPSLFTDVVQSRQPVRSTARFTVCAGVGDRAGVSARVVHLSAKNAKVVLISYE